MPIKYHSSITWDRLEDALRRGTFGMDNPGFCLSCGQDQDGCEPDARRIKCEACGEPKVFGAQECMIMGVAQQ